MRASKSDSFRLMLNTSSPRRLIWLFSMLDKLALYVKRF
nr:MAG TPA: hypothetical protein [Caudoviricetes sp.]